MRNSEYPRISDEVEPVVDAGVASCCWLTSPGLADLEAEESLPIDLSAKLFGGSRSGGFGVILGGSGGR